MATAITLLVSSTLLLGVKVPRQVMPPSLLVTVLRLPFSTVMSALVNSSTASLNVKVTRLVSPMRRAVSAMVMVTVGATVSTV